MLKKLISKPTIVIVNYEKLTSSANYSQIYQDTDWLMVICDEGHMLRNQNTLRTKAVFTLTRDLSLILTGM